MPWLSWWLLVCELHQRCWQCSNHSEKACLPQNQPPNPIYRGVRMNLCFSPPLAGCGTDWTVQPRGPFLLLRRSLGRVVLWSLPLFFLLFAPFVFGLVCFTHLRHRYISFVQLNHSQVFKFYFRANTMKMGVIELIVCNTDDFINWWGNSRIKLSKNRWIMALHFNYLLFSWDIQQPTRP